MQHISTQYAGHRFDFEQVNVILGANGAGKSKLLNEIKNGAHGQNSCKVVYIEGGRTIKIADVLKFEVQNFRNYDVFEKIVSNYEDKRTLSLADRLFDALVVLDRRDAQIKAEHSDLVSQWVEGGQQGGCPKRQQPPLERLFELFNEIFPLISLKYESNAKRLVASKGGNSYGPSAMSDGEKQVFSILADLLELTPEHTVIIADEPELNLHPELAERLWTLLENEFPEKIFIYATHSISFALRNNVRKVWIISADAANIAEFTGLSSLPRAETTALLGSLPGILSANQVIVTEGHEKSFDAIFYRWIMGDSTIEIFAAGGCSDVVSIVGKSGVWEKITSRIALAGIIDSDYRDDTYLHELTSASIHALPLHEAEAYLCVPDIIVAVASRIGSVEPPLAKEVIVAAILKELEDRKLIIAARRVFAASHIRLGLSLDRSLLSAAGNREQLLQKMREAAETEIEKAHQKLSPEIVESQLDAVVAEIDAVIAATDIERALRLLPAKELANKLAPRAGCKSAADLMRSLRHNFKPVDFGLTEELRQKLRLALVYEAE